MGKNEIFIVHQYLEKSHFKALYDCAEQYGYKIEDFIVLSKRNIFGRCIKGIIIQREIFKSFNTLYKDLYKLLKLRYIKDKTIIVGIAPYDKLLNKYNKYFAKNNSIYFTSWQHWDGSKFPKGNLSNKDKFEELLKNSFNGVACVSEETKKSMCKFFENIQVVNHAINTEQYKKKEIINYGKHKKYLYLGLLIDRKNIQLIIQWIIKNKNIDISFDFAGDGQLKGEIIKLSNIDSRVSYLGKLTKNEIKENLKNYDYIVLPSKEEPFGIVLIEALASGVPGLVSNALGPKEIIKNGYNGFVFDKEKEEEFSEMMFKSLNVSEDEYSNLHKNSLESSSLYDSENIIKKWIKVIENR